MSETPGELCYQCNICGQISSTPLARIGRETRTCPNPQCRSTPRFRSIIRVLSIELFGKPISLPDFPVRKDMRGLGMNDWNGYAKPLAEKLAYVNTFPHTDPRLEITNIAGWEQGAYDFLISSDMVQLAAPPTSVIFANCRALLKPGGVLILTVPYVSGPGFRTREHFPNLYDYTIVQGPDGKHRLINRTRAGRIEMFDNLTFHEGRGMALEMRVFGEESLVADLQAAGFGAIRTRYEPSFEHGIYWGDPHSWPITARR